MTNESTVISREVAKNVQIDYKVTNDEMASCEAFKKVQDTALKRIRTVLEI